MLLFAFFSYCFCRIYSVLLAFLSDELNYLYFVLIVSFIVIYCRMFYTLSCKKGSSTSVILTLENIDRFFNIFFVVNKKKFFTHG